MSPATALVALAVLVVARRLLPDEQRHQGRSLFVFLLVGLLLGVLRLGVVALGAGDTTAGVLLGMVTTFCVAMGAVGTAILVTLVVVPGRARLRVPSILRDITQAAAFVLIAFGVLSQSGVNVASLITTAGVLTAVIGLALQNTLANLFAGLMLNMDRELGVNDWVQVGGKPSGLAGGGASTAATAMGGQIIQIRWRSTLLRTIDGDLLIVPNSQMLSTEVYNFSRPRPRHRIWTRVSFNYRHPPNVVRQVLAEAAREAPGVLPDPLPDAIPAEFGESAMSYWVRFWTDQVGRQREVEGEVLGRIWYAVKRADLQIAYPTRDIYLHSDSEEARKSSADADRAERLRAVGRVDLFGPLDPGEREQLASGMKRVRFAAGESLIRQGDPGDSLYVIAGGQVRVSLQHQGDAQQVAMLGPGDVIGEMSLMTGERRAASCTAHTDVVAYVVDHHIVRQVVSLRPQVAEEISGILAARQAELARKGGELAAVPGRPGVERKRLLSMIRDFFDLD
jgi:small-conductance mechanosensitive channel/CRP-like cAMP-binding protein